MKIMHSALGIDDDASDNEQLENDDEEEEDKEKEKEDFIDDNDESISELMRKMDVELLSQPHIYSDFTRISDIKNEQAQHLPVDIDLNLAKNLLESYAEQFGMSGPLTNIIGALKENKT